MLDLREDVEFAGGAECKDGAAEEQSRTIYPTLGSRHIAFHT
jgi:hypothetical protein